MQSYAAEPGTLLVDRYRLEELVQEATVSLYWRARDEKLGRDVGLRILPADSPLAARTIAAARAAAAVTDARFLRILDASTAAGLVYVVSEWVRGRSLVDLLTTGGPLPPSEAARVAAEVAAAMESAHRLGLAHLCLEPGSVLRTEAGQVKVIGLCVEAAISGRSAVDPRAAARLDAQGCGALLYAGLTARWPGATEGVVPADTLAAAPYVDGHLCSPRQVRAGVPGDLDELTDRCLGAPPRHHAVPFEHPGAVAEALAAARPAAPAVTARLAPPDEAPLAAPPPRRPGPGRPTRLVRAAAAILLAAGLGLAGWQVALTTSGGGAAEGPQPTPWASQSAASSAAPQPTGTPMQVVSIDDFDPEGNGQENGAKVRLAVDGDPSTSWGTVTYRKRADLGGLKSGVGLLLDLSRRRQVGTVTIAFTARGSDVELRAADRRGDQAPDYQLAARSLNSSPLVTLRPTEPLTARYLLVWLTKLPPVGATEYRAAIAEITVRD